MRAAAPLVLALLLPGCLAWTLPAGADDVRLRLDPPRLALAPGEEAAFTAILEADRRVAYESPGCPDGVRVHALLADGRRIALQPLDGDETLRDPPVAACMVHRAVLPEGRTAVRFAWPDAGPDGAPLPPGEHVVEARLAATDLDVAATARVVVRGS